MKQALFICSTYYHVFISLCKIFAYKIQADFVICSDIPEGEQLCQNLLNSHCVGQAYFFRRESVTEYVGNTLITKIFFRHTRNKKRIEKVFKLDVRQYQDIYIYHDDIILGHYLNDISCPYHLVEDSLDFYQNIDRTQFARFLPQKSWKYRIRKRFNLGYFPLGQSKNVLDVEVNHAADLKIKHKNIKEEPREKLFERLTGQEREILKNIFSPQVDIARIRQCDAIVLTQPLYEDGFVGSWEEQWNVYLNILNDLKERGYRIAWKPHPRDHQNYSKLEDVYLLPANFPSEMFWLLNIHFQVAATVFSTAVQAGFSDQICYYPVKD